MSTRIQLKRGLDANFTSVNLASGEPAFVLDTQKLYIGTGLSNILINPINKPDGINTENYFTKYKTNDYGQIIETTNITEEDLPTISASKISGLGTAALLNTGTAENNIPILDENGKLNDSVIPSISVTDVFVVNSQAEMLALQAQVGDVAVRTDIKANFILKNSPATELDNWVKLLVPEDSVTSVNGLTGNVILNGSNVNMTGYVKPSSYTAILPADSINTAMGKLEVNFNSYATIEYVTDALTYIDGGSF